MGKRKRKPIVCSYDPSTSFIPSANGQFALVDTSDVDHLACFCWTAAWSDNTQSFYFHRQVGKSTLKMHRVITNASRGNLVDHINGNTADNRRANLRIVTYSQNAQNRRIATTIESGAVGVYWRGDRSRWRAGVQGRGRQIWLGHYVNKSDAVAAAKFARRTIHKEFTREDYIDISKVPQKAIDILAKNGCFGNN